MREYLKTHKREILLAYAQIVIGSVIGAAAYPTFLIPNNIAPGGVTGVGTILNYLAGWPVGITALILLPVLEHYIKTPRESIHYINLGDMMTLNENAKQKK